MRYLHQELTRQIIRSFYSVYHALGYGFLEKVYERSMLVEMTNVGLTPLSQMPIRVHYRGEVVGDYFADIVVNNLVNLEIKAGEAIVEEHESQLLNYLRATEKEVGLLLNFGKVPEIRRKIFTNDKKSNPFQGL